MKKHLIIQIAVEGFRLPSTRQEDDNPSAATETEIITGSLDTMFKQLGEWNQFSYSAYWLNADGQLINSKEELSE